MLAHRRVIEVLLEEHFRDHALQCWIVFDLLHERLLDRRVVYVQLRHVQALQSVTPSRDATNTMGTGAR